MILPLFLHPPPPQPLSRSCSSSSTWPSDALLPVNPHVFCDIYAASTQRLLNTEGRCSAQVLLSSSGTGPLRISDTLLSSPHLSAPSFRCSPDMLHSNKRLCKALEFSNCRSRVLVSDCKRTFDSTLRVLAVRHGQMGSEFEHSVDDDGSQLQVIFSSVEKKNSGKRKSAEELHFEAIEGYCSNYENEDNGADGSVVGFEAGTVPLEDTTVGDSVNAPVNKSKCLDVSGFLLPLSNEGSSLCQLNKRGDETFSQKNMPFDSEEFQTSGRSSQSMHTPNVNGTDRAKSTRAKTRKAQMTNISQDVSSASEFVRVEAVKACNSDTSQFTSILDEEEALQTQSCQSKNKEVMPKVKSANIDEIGDLNEEQKIRMELNKAAAIARRHMRICEDAVAEAQVKGLPFPKFESLLVEKSWAEALKSEFQKPYMERLHQFVNQEAAGRIPIYPPPAKLFNAFNSCPLDKVKVVIIGQDPYHGSGQAMGLCFSFEKGVKLPSSLTNIFLEIESDLGCYFPSHGNLEKWAYQGVLLLNTVLTVRDRHANSHAKKGWEFFTDAAIRTLVQQRSGVVFLLWGNQAQEKLRLINKTSHHILKAFHPSGISAHKGFFKCRHFSKANKILLDEGLLPIDWQL